jgi:FtsH-binding integral membrane protein
MRQDRSDPPGAKDHAIFCAVAGLMGISLGLLCRFADGISCAVFVIGAIAIAGWLHADFVDRNFSRARNALAIAALCAVSGGIGSRSWLMAAVPFLVFGLIGFGVLLVCDMQSLRGAPDASRGDAIAEDAMLMALSLYLGLAGVAVAIAGLVG